MTGYTGMFYDYGKGYPFPEYDIEFIDNFTKIAGRHTFKFGADETGYKNYIRQGGPALGNASLIRWGHWASRARGRATKAGRGWAIRKETRLPIFYWELRPHPISPGRLRKL